MKTIKFATTAAAVLLAVAAGAANATTRYTNAEVVATNANGGGEIIVAVNIVCRSGGGNFVMQTNRNADMVYSGCAFVQGSRLVISWNDGQTVSYPQSPFRRTTASLTV